MVESKKPILASVDAVDKDRSCLDFGVSIARKLKKKLHLYDVQFAPMRVLPGDVGRFSTSAQAEELQQEFKSAMETMEKQVQAEWPHTKAEWRFGMVEPKGFNFKSKWLLDQARELDAYLLIVQRERENSWLNRLIGTKATHIAGNAERPVLIVPRDFSFSGIQRLMYLMDRHQLESETLPNLSFLTDFARRFDAPISIAYFSEESNPLSEEELAVKMEHIRKEIDYSKIFYYQVEGQHSLSDLLAVAAKSKTDLLAFPYEDSFFLERIWSDDNSRQLILDSPVPVLVF